MADLYDEEYMHASAQFKDAGGEKQDGYKEWHKKVGESKVLDPKVKELISLGAAFALKCEYCIDAHTKKAKTRGASKEEIAETLHIAAIIGAGATISYGLQAFKSYEK